MLIRKGLFVVLSASTSRRGMDYRALIEEAKSCSDEILAVRPRQIFWTTHQAVDCKIALFF